MTSAYAIDPDAKREEKTNSLLKCVNPKSGEIIERVRESDGAGFGQDTGFHLVHDIGETDAIFRIGKGKASSGTRVAEG